MVYYISLGSNLNDPEQQLARARESLSKESEMEIIACSRVINTVPYGLVDQPDFMNQVLELSSSLEAQSLLQKLLEIETRMGRIRQKHWGPRVIDLDILLAENLVLDIPAEAGNKGLPALKIPHPDMHNRLFVLQPMMELCPLAVHPVLHKTISELYYSLIELGGPI